jgi:hypothetical protein
MTIFVIFAFAAAVAFLVLGLGSMMQGGEYDQAHATQYMTGRVAMQGVAFVLLLLALLGTTA